MRVTAFSVRLSVCRNAARNSGGTRELFREGTTKLSQDECKNRISGAYPAMFKHPAAVLCFGPGLPAELSHTMF